jgi:homoserine dehydrogenase
VLGDLVAIAAGTHSEVPPVTEPLELVADHRSAFYLHLEVEDRPGVLSQVATALGDEGISVRSVVQRGLGDNARLVMVTHLVSESRFAQALEGIAGLDSMRAAPRAIRVLEEEFTA